MGTRWTRCSPPSSFSSANGASPGAGVPLAFTATVTDLYPPRSDSVASRISVDQPRRSAYAVLTLVCATDGEAGKPHPSVGPVDDLGALRVEELRLSCARLGIEEPVLLRFHDSARKERQRHDDPHALANVDMLDVEAAIRGIIADVKPHVIVTFEPHGGYYHPDHLAIQRATTAAFFSSGVMGDEAPERLFYATMLRDVFQGLADASRGQRHHRRPRP